MQAVSVDLNITTALFHSGLVLGCTARRGEFLPFTGCNTLDFIHLYLCVCVFEKAVILSIVLEFHSF